MQRKSGYAPSPNTSFFSNWPRVHKTDRMQTAADAMGIPMKQTLKRLTPAFVWRFLAAHTAKVGGGRV